MKRIVGGLIAGVLGLLCVVTPATASPNDFRFSSFDADYYLGSDSEGRSTLKTVEKLVAEFPGFDQNHGIERAIPTSYGNHPTSLRIESVTDGNGNKLHFETSGDGNGNEVLRIGDAGTYVHGTQTYVITYTQRDVTKNFSDTNDVEFYWDTNGIEWPQPFGTVTARIHLTNAIAATFTKKVACYQGPEGSRRPCDISMDGTTITAHATNLGPYENMTMAVGFTLGTFRDYQPSFWDKLFGFWIVSLVVTSIIGFVAIFWLSFRYYRISNRSKELEPVPVEYIPPKGISVLASAQIGDGTRAETTAEIIDLAVRHYITITQTREKSLLKQAEYELEIVKPVDSLSEEETDFVQTLFGNTEVGTTLETKILKSNYSLYSKLQSNSRALKERIKGSYQLRAKDDVKSKPFKRIALVMLGISLLTVSPMMLIAAVVAFGCAWSLTPLTDKGLELRRYLAGLKKYIEVAEEERLKMLQSPEGAEKTGVKIKGYDDAKLVRLYERVLPYAVLFDQEKEWNKQLAVRYESSGEAPDWYVGQSAFNAAIFTSAMNDFTSSMNSYSASTSSSSGGSGGGGSSGGGGGGGGGGGW